MITKDLNFNQLVDYIKDNAGSDLLVITQDKIFRDALNRKLNEICLNEENWVRKSTKIMTLTQWYNMLWDKCRIRCILNNIEPPKIIDATSEIVLWRRLVADWTDKDIKTRSLINANGAADIMHKSWQLLVKHNYIGCSHTALLKAKDPQEMYRNDRTGQCKSFITCLQERHADDNGVLQPDHRALLQIAADYSDYMEKHNAVSSLLIPNAIVKILSRYNLKIAQPKQIILANFSEPEPQLIEFISFLEKSLSCQAALYRYSDKADAGCRTLLLTKASDTADEEIVSPFENLEEELVYAARKALAESLQSRAAVVIPELRGSVSETALILDKALAPEALIGGKENIKRPYSLISGEIIIKHPLIQDILNLLRLSMSTLSRQKLINIISDSFLNTRDRLSDKAELCRKLRSDFHSIYTLDDFSRAIDEYNQTHSSFPNSAKTGRTPGSDAISKASDSEHKKHAPLAGLKEIADGIAGLKNDLLKSPDGSVSDTDISDNKRSLSQWAEYTSELIIKSFARERISTDSRTADNAIATLLKELAKLRRVSQRHYLKDMNFSEFMQYLRLILLHRENKFYYRQDTESLRILTVNQALKSQFKHLYLIQFNDDNFPASVSAQGYIPAKLLDFLGYARANAQQALKTARRRIYALTQVTDNLYLSFSNTQKKNGGLLPSAVSPLWRPDPKNGWRINKMAVCKNDVPTKENSDPGFICCSKEDIWEQTEEVKLPDARPNKRITDNLTGEKKPGFRGGSKLINAMCNCPFMAFLTYRLRCEDDKPADEGLSNLDRGSLIHDVMEQIWKELNGRRSSEEMLSSDYLKSLTDEELNNVIEEKIDECLRKIHADSPIFNRGGAKNLLKENEKERIMTVLKAWFKNESQSKFKVEKLEEQIIFPIKLGDKTYYFDGRPDRIDINYDGNEPVNVIIDYKTGESTDDKSWNIDMPNEEKGDENDAKNSPKDIDYPLQDNKNYQLPLYACFSSDKIEEIRFAKLTLNEQKFLQKTIDVNNNDWKELITQRFGEFINGRKERLTPRPNPTYNNCRYCHLQTVCPYYNCADADE